MKSSPDIHYSLGIDGNNFDDPLTFPLRPLSGHCCLYFVGSQRLYRGIPGKLMALPSASSPSFGFYMQIVNIVEQWLKKIG